jgi:hypothetical protein
MIEREQKHYLWVHRNTASFELKVALFDSLKLPVYYEQSLVN